MTNGQNAGDYQLHVAELRQSFDQLFAAPDQTRAGDIDDFLSIRVGARPFALRVCELARIEVGRKLVQLPGGDPWLLGLTNCQGKLVPVHSLELALGFERTPGNKAWLIICGREEPLGLAFDGLDEYLRIPQSQVFSTGAAESSRKNAQQAIHGGGELRPVIHLPSIVAAVRKRIVASRVGEDS